MPYLSLQRNPQAGPRNASMGQEFYRENAYAHKGEYDRAIADYDQAIQLEPDDAEAYTNHGIAYADKGASTTGP